MYWVNVALEERNRELMVEYKDKKKELDDCESSSINAIANMEHYKGLYKTTVGERDKYITENLKLRGNVFIYKGATIGFAALATYFGIKTLAN